MTAACDSARQVGVSLDQRRASPCVNILGVKVTTLSLADVAHEVVQWATAPGDGTAPRYVCATSVHGLIEAVDHPSFRGILNRAAHVTPDGMPLVWFGQLRKQRGMSRVYGPTLMKEVCRLTTASRIRHFFYGGIAGVADTLARRLSAQYPGLRVAGTYSPPFRALTDTELRGIAAVINDSGAEVVWVGLSTPKQERWIDAIRGLLSARVLLSVGAAFDFHVGRVRQAPHWVQRVGLEWLFRLVHEPRRLWRRYAYNNPMFMWLALLQLAGLRQFASPSDAE